MKNLKTIFATMMLCLSLVATMTSCTDKNDEPQTPSAKSIAGTYDGDMTCTVLGSESIFEGMTFTVTAVDDATVDVTISSFGEPPMQVPEIRAGSPTFVNAGEPALNEKKTTQPLYSKIQELTPETLGELAGSLSAKASSVLGVYVRKIIEEKNNVPKIELLLAEYEIEADKNISTSKVLTKTGPILGLMGTLIPMGPALVGLASCDIASMAYNMQVAFATTVVGLVVSAIGFMTQQTKERWSVRNLTILEYLADIVKQSNNEKK